MNKKKSILLIIAVIAICFFIYLFKGNFNKGDYSQTYYDLNTVSEITLARRWRTVGYYFRTYETVLSKAENYSRPIIPGRI